MEWKNLLCTTRVRDFESRESTATVSEGEVRTPFEQDYDRAVFSTPLRRMQDKTQVFPLDPHDFVRTRLTHSFEVSTLTRDLARRTGRWLVEKKGVSLGQASDIESIAATCGLVHDLGNPPFGHAGEQAIGEWFRSRFPEDGRPGGMGCSLAMSALRPEIAALPQALRSDFAKFEGNAQTLRLVSRLQVLKDDTGLNLTAGTLSALMKYTASSAEADEKARRSDFKKPGHFASEMPRVERIRELTSTGKARNPITFLVEACDDIAYATLDFEDGIKKGLATGQTAFAALGAQAKDKKCSELFERLRKEADDYIGSDATLQGKARDEAIANIFRTKVIKQAMTDAHTAFCDNYESIMAGTFESDLIGESESKGLIKSLKTVDRELFYRADEVLRLEIMGRTIITGLLDLFLEGVAWSGVNPPDARDFPGKLYRLMSTNYRNVFERALKEGPLPPAYYRIQLVIDYVCGMTDTFARDLHERLTNG